MEVVVLILFCAVLLLFVLLDLSIVLALAVGLGLFLLYGRLRHFSWRELWQMTTSKTGTVRNILWIYVLIGTVTALWRACGTIPTIISYVSAVIHPSYFILISFLLNCGISILTGTGVGTAATMGTLCMALASTMEVNPMYMGGAILAGSYFGDRWSPVATGALLISELTETNLHSNLKRMFRSALPALLISCALYTLLGRFVQGTADTETIHRLFRQYFQLHWLTILPAASVLILAAFRFKTKVNLSISVVLSILCCILIQEIPPSQLLRLMILGYSAPTDELSSILSGGGIVSMVRVIMIIAISSAYSGIFEGTGLLNGLRDQLLRLKERIGSYGSILITGILTCMIACNQTMAIMLTHQLCKDMEPDQDKLALYIEDTTVVVAPLIPWSITCTIPLTSVGAPTSSIFFAFFLYLIPLGYLLQRVFRNRRHSSPV